MERHFYGGIRPDLAVSREQRHWLLPSTMEAVRVAIGEAPIDAQWKPLPGLVRHGFTHFELELKVIAGRASAKLPGVWCPIDRLSEMALPTLMKKVANYALKVSD